MWSVPGDMTIASQLEGRHLSLKQLAAFINKPDFRSKVLESLITKYFQLGIFNFSNSDFDKFYFIL